MTDFKQLREPLSLEAQLGWKTQHFVLPGKFYLVSKEADAAASAIPEHRQQMTAPKIARQFVEPSLAGQRAGSGH